MQVRAGYLYNTLLDGPVALSARTRHRIEQLKTRFEKRPRHLLVRGPSGWGKTAFCMALGRELSNAFRVINLGEEHYGVLSLGGLWRRIAETLVETETEQNGLISDLRHQIAFGDDSGTYLELFEQWAAVHDQRLVVILEHLDRLLRKLTEAERMRFGEFLAETDFMRLIATTSLIENNPPLAGVLHLLEQIRLEGLDVRETETLFRQQLGSSSETWLSRRPGLPKLWWHLTDGCPRLLGHLSRIIEPSRDDPHADLLRLIDRVTPDYQARSDRLSAQQQAIFRVIATSWDAVSAGEIATRLGLPSKSVSAQLGQMIRNEVVGRKHTNRKNHLYFLRDRFFDMWFLARHGTGLDRERLRLFLRFSVAWYAPRQIEHTGGETDREVALTRAAHAGEPHGWSDLGRFYLERGQQELATLAFEKGIGADDPFAMEAMARMAHGGHGDRDGVLDLARRAVDRQRDPRLVHTLMMVSLWNGHLLDSISCFRDLLDAGWAEDHPDRLIEFFLQMVATGKIQLLDRLFWENPDRLRDRFKPVYGLTMFLMREKYPIEHKRLCTEATRIIDEMLRDVDELRARETEMRDRVVP